MMLTEEKDRLLQQLSRTNKSARSIALDVGVSAGTVLNIRRACVTVDAMPEYTKRKIRRLLVMKVTSARISAMLNVPAESVRSLRRLDRFREPPSDDPSPARKRSCKFSRENFSNLLKIVNDLYDLGDLLLITNPLFHHLTQRAGKALKNEEEAKIAGRPS